MARRDIDSIDEPIWKQLISNFQANVKYYREKKGLTQAELAEISGLNVTTIAGIEQGWVINPRIESIAILTASFGLDDPVSLLKKPKK